jgi:hypothetical protein
MGVWAGRRGASAGRRGATRRVSWASEKRRNNGHPPWRSRWARHGLRLGHCIWCRSCRGRSGSCPLPPPQGALVIATPSRAIPSQCPARRHMPSGLVPIRPRRCSPLSTLGSGDGRNYWNRCPSRSKHSTGIPCGACRRWHPSPSDHRGKVDDTPGVCSLRGGRSGSIRSHNALGMHRSRRVFSWSSCINETSVGENCFLQHIIAKPGGIGSLVALPLCAFVLQMSPFA